MTVGRNKRFIINSLILTVLLGGCSQNKYENKPLVAINTHFPSATAPYKPQQDLPYLAWWQQFHDPNLNRYMQQSLQHNFDIQTALAQLEAARGELLQVKLSWLPTLKLFAGYSTNPALGIPGGFFGAWPYYTINILQQYQLQQRAQLDVAYAKAMEEGVRLTVIGQTAAAYFTLLAQREQLRILNDLQQNVQALIQYNRDDIKIGLKNATDLTPSITELDLIKAETTVAAHNVVLSENALHYLLGQDPGPLRTKKRFATIDFTKFKPGALPATVLRQRPDVKMAAIALRRARIDINLAYSDFFPILQLDQFVGENHLPHSRFAQMTDAYFNANLDPSVFGAVKRRKAEYQAALVNYVKTIRRVLRDVDNDFSANSHLTDFYQATKAAAHESRYNYSLQQGLLRSGLASPKEILSSKIEVNRLELYTNQAQLQLAMSLVMLYQDLAGGLRAQGAKT